MELSTSRLWATVLAGGSGRRLAPLTGGIPKQFWVTRNGETLLDATLARISPLVPASQTILVIDRSHESFVDRLSRPHEVRLLAQPCDRGTAAGVLFGIMPALESARDSVVLITPSDHGVVDTAGFRSAIRQLIIQVGRGRRRVVLLGVEPTADEGDYGWITPGSGNMVPRPALQPVVRFVEKPPCEVAARLRASGALWNTLVLVAKASTVLRLFRRHVPDVAVAFDEALRVPRRIRDSFLRERYLSLPRADFSRDVLAHANGLWVHRLPSAVGWSDLGTPARMSRWLERSARPLSA